MIERDGYEQQLQNDACDSLPIAERLFFVRRRSRSRNNGRRSALELVDKLVNSVVGLEANLDGIRADERTAENAARQSRQIITLERFERFN